MECKKSLAKSMFWRILFTVICVTLLICSLSLPASAAVLDYNDYVTNVKVDGDNDIVTVSFPLDSMRISLIEIGVGEVASVVGSSLSVVVSADTRYVVRCYPLGDSISLSNIPSDTVCSLSLSIDSRSWGFIDVTNAYSSFGFAYYGKSGNFLDLIWGGLNHDNEWDMTASEVLTPVPDAFSFLPMGDFCDFSFWEGRTVDIGVNYFNMTMTISSLYRLQQQSGKTNEILQEVEKQLEANGQTLQEVLDSQQQTNDKLDDTNNKLDDIISGGSGADDLIEGGNKIEDAGSGLGEDIGKIEDFEDQYMGQLEDNLGDVIAGADLTWLYPPLMFVQRYLNKIVAGIPSKYLIVFTLPMLFGLFMYIVGHPVRAPRPDTSGDQVTRETFTETTILKGPHAGRVSATRTVTTSQEIGRVHNE